MVRIISALSCATAVCASAADPLQPRRQPAGSPRIVVKGDFPVGISGKFLKYRGVGRKSGR